MSEASKPTPLPTLRRLPTYIFTLKELAEQEQKYVSTTTIAEMLKLDSTQVRKDIQYTGIVGKPKLGYEIHELILAIEDFLGWNNVTDAVLIGVGNLGKALLGHDRLREHGLQFVAAFDTDSSKVDQLVGSTPVFSMKDLSHVIHRLHIHLAVLTIPAEVAQDTANMLVEHGILAIWNFASTRLNVPEHVTVEHADLISGLAVLSCKLDEYFHQKQDSSVQGNTIPN